MKRIFGILTAMCMLFTLAVPISANAAGAEDLTFDAETGTITGCDKSAEGELVIPAEIDGVKVTAIGADAFFYCGGLTGVTIPDGVTTIGDNAFELCVKLESIELPEGVTSIGEFAFADCDALTSIIIPDGVTSISACMLAACDSLENVTIPYGYKAAERIG